MMKLIIEFDLEKIDKEGICKVEQFYAKLDRAINKVNLKKIQDGIYMDNGNPLDLSSFFAIISWLKQVEWFRRYAIRFDWYNDRLGTRKNFEPENMLEDIYLWKIKK